MDIITPRECAPYVSYLQHVFYRRDKNIMALDQAKITHWACYDSFRDFTADFFIQAGYETPQSNKLETRSFITTLFAESPSTQAFNYGEFGHWRRAEHAADTVSLFVADVDNQNESAPDCSYDLVSTILTDLRINHLLYTSFSHSPDKDKFRIICAIDREMTYDEAYKLTVWFNSIFCWQLDKSICDPGDHCYGPPFQGRRDVFLDGQSLCVDAIITLYDGLDDAEKARMERRATTKKAAPLTPAQLTHYVTQVATVTPSAPNVSITNPVYFNPAWMNDLHQRYIGGSRMLTMLGLLTRCWLKSSGSLSFGDMQILQREIDAEYGYHCLQTYRHDLDRQIKSAMSLAPAPKPVLTPLEQLKLKAERRAKNAAKYI